MTAFHQMGHDSTNLLGAEGLEAYGGAILSPINCDPSGLGKILGSVANPNFSFVFDPQLYSPGTNRGALQEWDYFPKEFESADETLSWWTSINQSLIDAVSDVDLTGLCSPVRFPRQFSLDYYAQCVEVAEDLATRMSTRKIPVYLTVILSLKDIASGEMPFELASLLSNKQVRRFYVLIAEEGNPRKEINDVSGLVGVLKFLHALKSLKSDPEVLMGYCGTELPLWKAAGVDSCATGKFFNLRHFDIKRFSLPPAGGGQIPYWFEESLYAYLQRDDVESLLTDELLEESSVSNPFGKQILEQWKSDPAKAWQGLSWRQYLWWFADYETHCIERDLSAKQVLQSADLLWKDLQEQEFIFLDRLNDGSWIRKWLLALKQSGIQE